MIQRKLFQNHLQMSFGQAHNRAIIERRTSKLRNALPAEYLNYQSCACKKAEYTVFDLAEWP